MKIAIIPGETVINSFLHDPLYGVSLNTSMSPGVSQGHG